MNDHLTPMTNAERRARSMLHARPRAGMTAADVRKLEAVQAQAKVRLAEYAKRCDLKRREHLELIAENGAFYVFARTHRLSRANPMLTERAAMTLWREGPQYHAVRAGVTKLLEQHGDEILASGSLFWPEGAAPWDAALEIVRLYRGCQALAPTKQDSDFLERHYAVKLLKFLEHRNHATYAFYISRAKSLAAIRKYGPTGGKAASPRT
jgi:hypothetical protein